MRRIIAVILLSTLFSGCTKSVTIPQPIPPPDIVAAVKAIAESDIGATDKVAALKSLAEIHQLDLKYLSDMYEKELARAREAGGNINSWLVQLLGLVGVAVTATLAATK